MLLGRITLYSKIKSYNKIAFIRKGQSMNFDQINKQHTGKNDAIQEGFSSEEQLNQQEIVYVETPKEKKEITHKQQIRFKIPPPTEIKDKKYSLHPDIVTGWEHKIQLPSPIPLVFDAKSYDYLIKKILKKTHSKSKICYLGPRYQNTFYAWYDKNFQFPYSQIKAPNNMKFTERPFCGQHWEAETGLQFDSFFESGNLDSVIQVGPLQYDLFMRVDTNTRGHLQWFNFKIRNLKVGEYYKLNICNFQKGKILFGRGAKPYILSSKKLEHEKVSWEQSGQNITYDRKLCKTYKVMDYQSNNQYKLSFTINTKYQKDQLQLAYCIPYTYTQLKQYLDSKVNQLQTSGKNFLKVNKLCTSLGGLEVPLLIIKDSSSSNQTTEKQKQFNINQNQAVNVGAQNYKIMKKCVVVCGRAHPGESNGSHMMQGFLNFICGNTKQAEFLRKYLIFKIVPMLNPDGVALGNYRTGLSGRDFNREYRNPDKQIFPQVYAFKKLVTQNKYIFKDNLNVFLDFHGHSVKKNTFAYGPQFPIVNKYYYESRIFPKILGNITPMFRYYSCSFKVSECKLSTARAILLKKLNIPLSFTIQTSNGFYFDYQKLKDIPYTGKKWIQMGEQVGFALKDYFQLIIKAQLLRHQKQKLKKMDKKTIGNNIIIRKSCRSTSNSSKNYAKRQNFDRLANNPNIGGNIIQTSKSFGMQEFQDQGIKKIFDQIKRAQLDKQNNLKQVQCSDDQMSEGTSDIQGKQDDLSSKQINEIFNVIKNKKFKSVENCKLKNKKRIKSFQTDSQTENTQKRKSGKKSKNDDKQKNFSRVSQQLIRKQSLKMKSDERKDLVINLMDNCKKRSTTPKVVNFSFGQHTPSNPKMNQDKNKVLPSKINFFDMGSGKCYEPKSQERQKPSKFSDTFFRKTFGPSSLSIKQKVRQAELSLVEQKQNPTSTGKVFYPGNKRNFRFQNYRQKKFAIINYSINDF